MADRILKNTAFIEGKYDDMLLDDKTTELSVLLADVAITKTADRKVWFQGELTLTITVSNKGDGKMTELIITDTLDITKFKLIETSITLVVGAVTVDPVDYDYDDQTGLLTVSIPEIKANEAAVITFRGTKVP